MTNPHYHTAPEGAMIPAKRGYTLEQLKANRSAQFCAGEACTLDAEALRDQLIDALQRIDNVHFYVLRTDYAA